MQSSYVDTAIAVFFVFLLFSVIAYVVQEWWASARELRAKLLEYAIHEVLNDKLNKSFGVLLYEHPQVDLLKRTQNHLPSYIPPSHFAAALIDLVGRECVKVSYKLNPDNGLLEEVLHDPEKDPFKRFAMAVEGLHYSELKILLQTFLQNSTDYATLKKTIESWFNQYMDRVSGWYEKDTRLSMRMIAAILVVVFNIDAIYLVQNVYNNSQLRNSLVAAAEQMVNDPSELNAVIGHSLNSQLAYVDSSYRAKLNATPFDSANLSAIKQIHTEWAAQRKLVADSLRKQRESQLNQWVSKVNSFGLPIGWNFSDSADIKYKEQLRKKHTYFFSRQLAGFEYDQNKNKPEGIPKRTFLTVFAGWVIAAICISFGAPFWFNLLGKLVRLRSTGVNPAEKKSEKNE